MAHPVVSWWTGPALRRMALCALVMAHATVTAADANPTPAGDELVALGQRLYRDGVRVDGQPLAGVGAAGVVLTGRQAACITCHRRSGYGSSEGSVTVRAITGPALFGSRAAPLAPGADAMIMNAPLHATQAVDAAGEAARDQAQALRAARTAAFSGQRQRPNYDPALLVRALREGIDVTGQAMNPAMPRFALGDADLRALEAYLRTLSAEIAPGVTEDTVHFATVIQPGVDAARRQAMVEVLQAFIRDRNQGRRSEQRREQTGMVRLNRVVRQWVLHEWQLEGAPQTWGAQLDARYRAQPVFALVSGLGTQDWAPIHAFCEANELPEVFPQTSLPDTSGSGFYSIYLNRGTALEARALARFLGESEPAGEVLQVWRDEGAGRVAAQALRQAFADSGASARVTDRVLRGAPDARLWQELAARRPGTPLVLWLGPEDLAGADALLGAAPGAAQAKSTSTDPIYLSTALGGDRVAARWPGAAARLRVMYPMDLPEVRGPRLDVVRQWMKRNGIAVTDEVVQMNAYLAATVAGMSLTHSADTYSREYFVERVEHRMGTAVELSIYPRLSLGPGQRFASKGSYVVEPAAGGGALRTVSDWIVP